MISIDFVKKELAALEGRLAARMEQAFLVESKAPNKRRRTKSARPAEKDAKQKKSRAKREMTAQRLAQDPTWALVSGLLILNCNMINLNRKRAGPILLFNGPVQRFKRSDSILVTYWPVMKQHVSWLLQMMKALHPIPCLDLPSIFSESISELVSMKEHVLHTDRVKQVRAAWGNNIDSAQLVAVPIKQCLSKCLDLVRESESFAALCRQVPNDRSWLEKQPLAGDHKSVDAEFVLGFSRLAECDALSGFGHFWQLAKAREGKEEEEEEESDKGDDSGSDKGDDSDMGKKED